MSEKGESSSSLNKRACASCKHQRRKCRPGCIMARYFPPERAAEFQAVQRLFGVSNFMKFYNAASSEQRNDVAESLTLEAKARHNHPGLGCVAIIHDLCTRIDAAQRELDATCSQLDLYRRLQQEQQQQIQMQQLLLAARQQQPQEQETMMPPSTPASMLDLHAYSLLQQHQQQQQQQQEVPLPPSLPPPVFINLVDEGVDIIGTMKEDERSGNSHGWQPISDEEAIRSFNPAAAPPNPMVDLRSNMPGSSNPVGLDELCGIQDWGAREQGLDGLKAETEDLFIHNLNREPSYSA